MEVEKGRKGGKEEGRMKGKRKEDNKVEMKRREMEGSSLVWAWPVLHNTDIHLKRWRHKDNYLVSMLVSWCTCVCLCVCVFIS